MNKNEDLVIGVDYGTASVRAIIVNARNGEQKASAVYEYPRWKAQKYIDASKNQYRQHPLDYIEGLEFTIVECLKQLSSDERKFIRAISVDATGSTPVALDEKGVPLALKKGFEENPNAMFFLWKDHTAIKEATEINAHAAVYKIDYLKYSGGIYSSEWFWSKLLYTLRTDKDVREACYSYVELCDWIPFLLTGGNNANDIKRGVCAAGHKGLWSESWNGFPPNEFFTSLDPLLDGYVDKLSSKTYTADNAVGSISPEWAEKLGISTEVLVGIGVIDAHAGAVGGEIQPKYLTKVMGTSTCDMLVTSKEEVKDKVVNGICGQVNGSIIPELVGFEAGQSAFGDVFAWFKDIISWPFKDEILLDAISDTERKRLLKIETQILSRLNEEASKIVPEIDSELAIEWLNGRRTPDANQSLKATISGLSLGTNAPAIYRSLVEATCFGAKSIVNRFVDNGLMIEGIIGIGGVAKKSPFIMQMMADILEMPIKIHYSEQTCALGACMFAATVAGIHDNTLEAIKALGTGFEVEYKPNLQYQRIYRQRFEAYKKWCHKTEYELNS